jgi:IS30 family transposase
MMLLHKSWWYNKWEYKYWKNKKILELESIENREEEINNRERVWDYEVDLIVSRKSKSVILNVVDRKSRISFTKKLASKSKEVVKEALREILRWKEVKSITTDNGTEFTDLIDICKELWIKWYRCHPYSSWEKWSVEVNNGYIRRYIPKWVDIEDYSEEYIEEITRKINNLPRKLLWYKTPEEVYYGKNIKYFD